MNNIYQRGSKIRSMIQKGTNENTKNKKNISIKVNDFPSLSSNNKNTIINKKWGKKENNDNPKPRLPPVKNITKQDKLTVKNMPWKYTAPIKTQINHIPENYVRIREVCGDDSNIINYFGNYTNNPLSDEMADYLSDVWVEKYGVWGWYRECDEYDLYPTRESWIDMWEPDQILLENGYPSYDTDSSYDSESDPDSPLKQNTQFRTGFMCPTCNYDFPSRQRLIKHMRQTDHGDNDYEISTSEQNL